MQPPAAYRQSTITVRQCRIYRSNYPVLKLLIASTLLSLTLNALALQAVWSDVQHDIDELLQQSRHESGEQNYQEAENRLRQALSLSVRSIGGMSSVTGKVTRQLGQFFMNRGRYNDAEHYLQRALVIASGYTGAAEDSEGEFQNTRDFVNDAIQNPNHLAGSIEVATTYGMLADLRTREGRYADAERMLKRCVQIFQTAGQGTAGSILNYSPDSVRLLAEYQRSLAQVLVKQGNVNEAESTFKDYVETVRKEKGPSPELAEALSHLSAFYKSQGRGADAESTDAEIKELQGRFR